MPDLSRILFLNRVLSKSELQREKTKDYRNVVLIQIIIIVFGLTLSEPILEDSKSEAVWGNIYGMLIIGRLLGLPREQTPAKG